MIIIHVLPPGAARELGHASLPRLRDAQLIRTYRPNPRYLPHHMRRQRTSQGEQLQQEQRDQAMAGELRELAIMAEQRDQVHSARHVGNVRRCSTMSYNCWINSPP